MKTIEDKAHEILLKLIETDKTGFDAEGIAAYSYEIAEAMQAEAEKRKVKEEWQPDWSQAPEWATTYTHDRFGGQWWDIAPSKGIHLWLSDPKVPCKCLNAPSFGYKGNWKDSLRKRP